MTEIKRTTAWTKDNKGCGHEMPNSGNILQDIYREHLNHRQIVISGEIDDETVDKVSLQIMKFNEEDDEREACEVGYDRMTNPITLKISSPGGYVRAGLSVISQIIHSSTPVITVAVGDCSSMGALIFLSGHARFVSMYSRIMIHSLCGGTADKLQGIVDYAEYVKKEQQMLDDIIVSKTAITQTTLTALHQAHTDWYLTSEEAITLGVADEMLPMGIPMVKFKDRKKPAKAKSAKR